MTRRILTPSLPIGENEITFDFLRAAGPGGQNVNKVETAVQLRFDVRNSTSLPKDMKERLIRLAGRQMTAEGVLVIEAKRHRTQEQNRVDALRRLKSLLEKAARRPKVRRATRPSAAAREKRLERKKQRGEIKRMRQRPGF